MSYFIPITDEYRYKYKNRCLINDSNFMKVGNTLPYLKGVALSNAIEIKKNDIFIMNIPKNLVDEFKKEYENVDITKLCIIRSNEKLFDDDGTILKFTGSSTRLFTNEGQPTTGATESEIIFTDLKTFETENCYVYSHQITSTVYKYIYIYSTLLDNNKMRVVDGQLPLVGAGIIREGDSKDDEWHTLQNNIAFQNYLHQSHIKKFKKGEV